jgi:hypothetical protein
MRHFTSRLSALTLALALLISISGCGDNIANHKPQQQEAVVVTGKSQTSAMDDDCDHNLPEDEECPESPPGRNTTDED